MVGQCSLIFRLLLSFVATVVAGACSSSRDDDTQAARDGGGSSTSGAGTVATAGRGSQTSNHMVATSDGGTAGLGDAIGQSGSDGDRSESDTAGAPGATPDNLLLDGDFSTPPESLAATFGGSTDVGIPLGAWTALGNIPDSVQLWPPDVTVLPMGVTGQTCWLVNTGVSSSVTQAVSTVVGHSYRLSFYLEQILELMSPAETRSSRTQIEAVRGSERRAVPNARAGHGTGCARSSSARRPSAAVCRGRRRATAARRVGGYADEFPASELLERRAGSRSLCRDRYAQGAADRVIRA
jgi:hypothetical protein